MKEAGCSLGDLMALGPFPEPLLAGSATAARRWSRQHRSRLVREDVASLEHIDEMGALEQLSVRLPELVGSPLSLNALREDLQVAHKTVERWVDILERLMFVFRLAPFGPPRIKAVKKSRKHYLFDWTTVDDRGARFENLVGFHLLNEDLLRDFVASWLPLGGYEMRSPGEVRRSLPTPRASGAPPRAPSGSCRR